MSYFTGKHAAITGAASGIGRALAQQLNSSGCHLYLSDIDENGLSATVGGLSNSAAKVHSRVVDVARREDIAQWADEISTQAPCLHLLVNNAGVALIANAADTREEDFHWLMNINFWGVVRGCQLFLPLLERAPKSHLINISSVFGMIGVPTQSAYNAAKFAVRGYSEALGQELDLAGSPVKLCCVHPGGVDTDIARRARNSDPTATAETQQLEFAPHVRTSAEKAAGLILRAAERGQRRLLIGPDARVIDWVLRLFPSAYPRLFRRSFAAAARTE